MPNNDREVFQHFLNEAGISPEIAHLAYAGYASSRYDWATRFEERKGRPPNSEEVDEWIAEQPPSRFVEILQAAEETFDLAATAYMANRIEAEKERAVRDSILDAVKGIREVVAANNREVLGRVEAIDAKVAKATSFRGTWLPNTFTGIIASFGFTVIVLIAAAIYHRDPSLFALLKVSGEAPAANAPPRPQPSN